MTNYELFADAIRNKLQVSFTYDGYYREVCPHSLGRGPRGNFQVHSFQFGGSGKSGLKPGGDWRCMELDRIVDPVARTGEWHTRDDHSRPQNCVKVIEVEVSY